MLGVNLMGVAHGVRVFTPMMLEAAAEDPAYEGHIVNTASMAGLLNPPNMGVYNVSKHAVVALSETLYQDLRLVTEQIGALGAVPVLRADRHHRSQRNRPAELRDADKPTKSQLIGTGDERQGRRVSGKVSAADVAQFVFDAIGEKRFYIYSHPKALASVQTRLEDIMQARNPTDPFAAQARDRRRAARRASFVGLANDPQHLGAARADLDKRLLGEMQRERRGVGLEVRAGAVALDRVASVLRHLHSKKPGP